LVDNEKVKQAITVQLWLRCGVVFSVPGISYTLLGVLVQWNDDFYIYDGSCNISLWN